MAVSNITAEIIGDGRFKAYFAIAGGGTDALADLLRTPGASGLVEGAAIPYSPDQMIEFLGYEVAQACCQATAWKMANAAFRRVINNKAGRSPLGVACTAALGTNRVRKGESRAHIALQTSDAVYTFTVRFARDEQKEQSASADDFASIRAQQEQIVSKLLLSALKYVQKSEKLGVRSFLIQNAISRKTLAYSLNILSQQTFREFQIPYKSFFRESRTKRTAMTVPIHRKASRRFSLGRSTRFTTGIGECARWRLQFCIALFAMNCQF